MQQDAAKETDLQEPANAPEAVEAPVAEDGDPAVEEAVVEELDEVASLTAQLAEWKEAAVRATADLDNYRKRMAREKTDLIRYSNQSLLEELLPLLDNFEMGLQAAAQDEGSMIFQGMQMVKKQLDDFLTSQGVEEVPAEGVAFDPNVHEAVSQEKTTDAECGAVLHVLRRGYRMNDRLLRPANVVVAKAPAEAGEAE
ncbi:MAG: nucleotide exchange factor GrpE [Akkermansiaceae bacterium]|nr:nucleotide exchange factor GrpE [Akkermansiaceae bacterium]|tara:strand:- start:266 stop:859 length:594 start_codon:yes stop_codon:yes gene_type:complete